jgi:putative aldouronate transport system substrate-binding protein
MGDTPFAKGLTEKTGISIEWLHPAAGAEREAFNLMIADGNLPDIVEYNWGSYPGGLEKAVDDGMILPLNEAIDKYCPNLKAYLRDHPDVDKMIKTDKGNYCFFPFLRATERQLFSEGLMIRKDWLDDLGLKNPSTLDEFHDVLAAFRDKKGAKAPLTLDRGRFWGNNSFLYAYGQEYGFYIHDDGRVHHGVLEPGFRQYLETMARWYKEGLIDQDFPSQSRETVAAKITSGVSGATEGSIQSGMMTWNAAAQKTNPGFLLRMLPGLALRKGDKPGYGFASSPYSGSGNAAITAKCKNVEAAARLLDYGYSPEGIIYHSFGTEGLTYNMVNGVLVVTDLILNNPQGLSLSYALGPYARKAYNGPFVQLPHTPEMDVPERVEATDVILNPSALKHKLPNLTPTQEESRELARIVNEINAYIEEMTTKYILGIEPLSSYDTFITTVRRMGIERAIEIENAALARYNKR